MKHTSACSIAAMLICLPVVVTAGNINIDRNTSTIKNVKDYDQIRDSLDINYTYQNHDDSVGVRGTNSGLDGTVIVDSNKGNANSNLAPIDCTHHAYKPICDELKDYIDNAGKPDEGANPQWRTIYSGTGTNTISVPEIYTHFRVSYQWEESRNKSDFTARSVDGQVGSYNNHIGITVQSTTKGMCQGGVEGPVATATVGNSVVATRDMQWTANQYARDYKTGAAYCNPAEAIATYRNFTITSFEVYY
ncbi:TPA: hypothetical protein ACGUU0_003134 [Vibrio vulnificus]